MAKKSAVNPAQNDVQELPPAMDYAQHNGTYEGFIAMVKWGIITMAVVMVALYCFIVGEQPVIGTLLLLAIPVGAVVLVVTGSRSNA